MLFVHVTTNAQPFIGKTELFIKSNPNRRNLTGDDAINGERRLAANEDSFKYDYFFNNADHLCYKTIFTPFYDNILQRSITSFDQHYEVIKQGKEWCMSDMGTNLIIKLEYSNVSNQFVLVYTEKKINYETKNKGLHQSQKGNSLNATSRRP